METEWYFAKEHRRLCPLCHTPQATPEAVVDHLRAHILQCTECTLTLSDISRLLDHIETVHLKRKKEVTEEDVIDSFVTVISQLR